MGCFTSAPSYIATYDALRRLLTWQDKATAPTKTETYAYNGAGERVQQVNGTTTTTYVGGFEEVSTTGTTTNTTKYYQAGPVTAVKVNGVFSYLVQDSLKSVSIALNASGSVTATALYAPYGVVRYSSGTMPTSYGYTDQRLDGSGLSYYHARYYDSSVGQFTSADVVQGPNRYAYVGGNPETQTDPTGCSREDGLILPGHGHLNPELGQSQTDTSKKVWPDYGSAFIQTRDHDMCHSLYGHGCLVDLSDVPNWWDVAHLFHKTELSASELSVGNKLAKYFGTTVIHPGERNDPNESAPDFYVGVTFNLIIGQVFTNATAIDVYSPGSANWNQIKNTIDGKGRQAGIVVVDLRGLPSAADLSFNNLVNQAKRVIAPGNVRPSSGVQRIIYITNSSVNNGIIDVNPWAFGPTEDPSTGKV